MLTLHAQAANMFMTSQTVVDLGLGGPRQG